jgi:predicted AAA+ superfamily ATPase
VVGMEREIKRDYYLEQLINRMDNGLIKIVTGIRRCGKSYLLRRLFKKYLLENGIDESHIIEMAFDLYDNIDFRNPKVFYPWAMERIKDGEKYCFLLDEVQLLDEFVSVLNGLADKKNCDVYVTGSNAKFLSKDIATEFGGRGDEVCMYPLNFAEFMTVYDGNHYDGWNEYITYGGIPLVVLADTYERKISLLNNLFTETYIRDIVQRNKVRNVGEMEAILDVLSSSIGALTNPNKLQNAFRSKRGSKITATTITKYIEYLEDAFLVEEAKRYDIKGKAYIGTPQKYYFTDIGLRNSRINFRQLEVSHLMENVIYNELRMRGFSVDVGNITTTEKDETGRQVKKQLEVDFICRKGSEKYYIQSSYALGTTEKMGQEIRPFLQINDSFKKILITSDTPKPFYSEEGILVMNVYDFLLEKERM